MVRRIILPALCATMLLGLLFAVACNDDNGTSNGDDATATEAVEGPGTDETPEATETPDGAQVESPNGGGAEGDARVIADDIETTLGVDDCMLPDDDGPIVVTATNPDENASFSMAGIAGAVTAEFNRDGQQWIAVGAILEKNGSTASYDGPALKTDADPPGSQLFFEVTC
jgi:hypothetical protein